MMQQILRILDAGMQEPEMYGWFHLLWLGLMIAAIAVLYKDCRGKRMLKVNRVVLTVSLICILLEVYKQINFNLDYSGEQGIQLDLHLYALPWQFCSTPMYAGLLAGLIRKGPVHDALCAYLATYALFAGISVMVYPVTVFTGTIGINIQTMFCHGAAVVIGVYMFISGQVKPEFRTLCKAFPVFAVAVVIAIGMNEAAYFAGLLEEHDINMFYISRHGESELPVYSQVQKALPYPAALLVYIFGFTAAADCVLLMAAGIKRLSRRRCTKHAGAR